MITHYLKVAIRNLLAHKTQTLVSLFGLALAFACVSLASFWNHYERTYDAFEDNADRIYRVRLTDTDQGVADMGRTPTYLHYYLKEKYPEVESSCAINTWGSTYVDSPDDVRKGFKVSMNGKVFPEEILKNQITSETLDIFGLEWIEGNEKVQEYENDMVAISERLARNLCGNQSPIGQILEIQEHTIVRKLEVVGVFKDRTRHSNLRFDIIQNYKVHIQYGWSGLGPHTYVMLKPGVDHKKFAQKLQADTIRGNYFRPLMVFGIVTPLTELRYTYPDDGTNITLEDINLFTVAAILLALCALLNYLTLFVSRLYAHGRNMALRAICGSSTWQISGLLLTEYLLLLLTASLLGMLFVELAMQKFMEFSMIRIEFSSVLISCGCLMLFSVLLSILLSAIPILYFKRKTLRVQIEAAPVRLGKNYFRSIGVCMQLVIGFLFIFCIVVMMKQVHTLINVDNIECKKMGWVMNDRLETDLMKDVLKQQPFIKESVIAYPLYPKYHKPNQTLTDWDGKPADSKEIPVVRYGLKDEAAQFYGLKMKSGPASFELGAGEVFINEALVKKMNMENPIGKTIAIKEKRFIVKGVIRDFQIQNPKTEPIPFVFSRYTPKLDRGKLIIWHVLFKYDGDWETCKKKLTEALQKRGIEGPDFADAEEFYQSFLESEYNLLKLLGVITIVSILIAIFGIYALIMQSCDQHQKEIAIRKVFGAKVIDILMMFFKQYMMQIAIAAVIAFPIGYFLMKNWLQQYARQTEISFWIYLAIFVGISLLVTLCIGWRVWKAANENPADVVKSEC